MNVFKGTVRRAVLAVALCAVTVTGTGVKPAAAAWSATGDVTFAGTAHLPQFPCTSSCYGDFYGTWTGNIKGVNETAAFEAVWTTTRNRITAWFDYSETLCGGPGSGAVLGHANGYGWARAYGSEAEAFGVWHQVGETLPRTITQVNLDFSFEWERAGNSAVIVLRPVWLNLWVTGLGWRQVLATTQRGAATFAPTHSDAPPTGIVSCDNPLRNVQGEITGNVPLTEPTV